MVGVDNMNDIFVSIGYDTAMKKYLLFTSGNRNDLAVDYFVYIIMMLTFIYSKTDITNPYLARFNNGVKVLKNNLLKYGLPEDKLYKFFNDMNNFLEIDNYNKVYNLYKNDYFISLQEDLIDMYLYKVKTLDIKKDDVNKFMELLYSSKSKNASIRKINELYNTNIDGSIRYFNMMFSKNDYDIKLVPKKNDLFDLRVYNLFDIDTNDIVEVNANTLDNINNGIYNYFQINPLSLNAKDKVLAQVEKLMEPKFRLSDNTGSVNLLLFICFFGIIVCIGITLGIILI